jgi:hypothetical protein
MVRLHQAQEEHRSLEKRVGRAPLDQRDEMERLLRGLNSQIAKMQREVLGTYPVNFIDCRDVGHKWRKAAEVIDDAGLNRTLTCANCRMDRVETITRHGLLVTRAYSRPEGYVLPKGMGIGRDKSFWRGLAYMQVARA